QLRRQPRTNSLALVQAQRLIQKVPITSCPVPIAPPPVGDRPNQRVQRSWLEVLQRQPTGPSTRQLFVQPLQQFPQGQIGRASCRERGEGTAGAGPVREEEEDARRRGAE